MSLLLFHYVTRTQSILKAYLRGLWDSVKGVSLIFIVIRDTYSSNALKNDKPENELDENSSNSSNAQTNKRPTRRTQANKRELNKLKEYDDQLKFIWTHFLRYFHENNFRFSSNFSV